MGDVFISTRLIELPLLRFLLLKRLFSLLSLQNLLISPVFFFDSIGELPQFVILVEHFSIVHLKDVFEDAVSDQN